MRGQSCINYHRELHEKILKIYSLKAFQSLRTRNHKIVINAFTASRHIKKVLSASKVHLKIYIIRTFIKNKNIHDFSKICLNVMAISKNAKFSHNRISITQVKTQPISNTYSILKVATYDSKFHPYFLIVSECNALTM